MGSVYAADLTAWKPTFLSCESGNLSEVSPVFCLPVVDGERPLVGNAAVTHRRASDSAAWPGESRLDLLNRGRYHLCEGWLGLARDSDSIDPANVSLSWTPPGVAHEVSASFVEVLSEYLSRSIPTESTLALVIPDALGPGPRQELLDGIGVRYRRVFLIPRTAAVALAWCEGELAGTRLHGRAIDSNGHFGNLFVTTSTPDAWEAASVPIRMEGQAQSKLYCPVNERVDFRSELGLVGLPRLSVSSSQSNAKLLWQDWLCKELCDPSGIDQQVLANRESGFFEYALPNLRLPGWKPADALDEVRDEIEAARTGAGILGWVHLGHEGSVRSDAIFRELGQHVGLELDHADPHFAVRGAAIALRRLEQGIVPYYESLAEVDLYVEGRNEFRDPVQVWRPLIEQAEVPVGKTYRSPEPIRDVALKADLRPEIDLYIRSKRRGREFFGHKQVTQESPVESLEPLRISAQMNPGQGLAQFDLESDTPGAFFASVRESETRDIPKAKVPELTFGWPTGSAWVLSHPFYFELAEKAVTELLGKPPTVITRMDLKRVRDLHNNWDSRLAAKRRVGKAIHMENFSFPRQLINEDFVWFGAFPSSEAQPPGRVGETIQRYADFLSRVHSQTIMSSVSKGAMYSASWFQEACPDYFLEQARRALAGGTSDEHLAVAGQCFSRPEDYRLFFRSLVRSIKESLPPENSYWLRALRNLVRFRVGALDTKVLSVADQNVIMKWYLECFEWAIEERSPGYLMQCSYLAPHMLKRRRFDQDFLSPDRAGHGFFRSSLSAAKRVLESQNKTPAILRQRAHLEVALEMLDHKATLGDLGRISDS